MRRIQITQLSGKRKIIRVAINLFAEKGIANVSLVQLAAELGASRGMIYHHFKHGKRGIVTAILRIFEDCVRDSGPALAEWSDKSADAEVLLHPLFFRFPDGDALQLRKVIRIILAEMYHDLQIAQYVQDHLIAGREKLLADCFRALMETGKIVPVDAESAARYFNRLLMVCAIEDALRYPYTQDAEKAEEVQARTVRDCANFLRRILVEPPANRSFG